MLPFAYHHPHNESGVTARVDSGIAPALCYGFEVPIVTATNHASEQNLERQIVQSGILHVVGRNIEQWSWRAKIYPVAEKAAELLGFGYDAFIFADSNDCFFYRPITRVELERALGPADMLLQDDRTNWPGISGESETRDLIVRGLQRSHGSQGPSAGLWAARIRPFLDFCALIRNLEEAGCKLINYLDPHEPHFGSFNDQGAWRLMALLFPNRIAIDTTRSYFNRH